MTINERVRFLRKDLLHLSQAEMANTLGITQSGMSYMERTPSAVTEQNIKAFGLLYNVNEDWLRYGVEPIFTEKISFSLDTFATSKGATPLDIEIVKAYLDLDPSIRKHVLEHFKKYLASEQTTVENQDFNSESSSNVETKYSSLEKDNHSSVG